MYSEKNDGFSLRDIFIQLLFIILFIFILVWLFPTKASINNQYADINGKLDALTSSIYGNNLRTMKEAAVSYYTTERLPQKVNDVKKMTLKQMIENHLVVDFVDGNGKACDTTASYVEVIKLENEYQMKINLSCTDNDAYIIVHLGCYDYCKATGVCEKKETTVVTQNNPKPTPTPVVTTCNYEYKLVTDGKWGDFGNWSSWSTSKVTENDYRKVEMKKEEVISGTKKVVTGTKTESLAATASTSKYCPAGYTANGDKCTRDANAYYVAKCPTGYTLTNGVCYGTQTTTTTIDPTCPAGYTRSGAKCYKQSASQVTMTPSCPDGYKLSGNNCTKEVTTGATITYVKGEWVAQKTGSSVPANNKTYIYEALKSEYVYACNPGCEMQWIHTYDVYKAVAVTSGGKTETSTVAASCATGYTLSNGVCYKSTTVTDTVDATCASGYTLVGERCSKSSNATITKTPSCPTGYTLSGDRCYGTVKVDADYLTSVSYSCPTTGGYTLNGKNCTRTVDVYGTENVYETVTYYRYKERKYISGTVDTKWSQSDNDTSLLNKGYSLTGNKNCTK